MKKKWVFWLVFSVVVTILVFTVLLLLLKGIRRSRRVDEVTLSNTGATFPKRNNLFSSFSSERGATPSSGENKNSGEKKISGEKKNRMHIRVRDEVSDNHRVECDGLKSKT